MNDTQNFTFFACPPSTPPPLAPPPTGQWTQQVPVGFWMAFATMAVFSLIGTIQTFMIVYHTFCRRRLPPETLAALSGLKERRRKEVLQRSTDDDL